MPLPGGSGTMKRTVRCGQDWACVGDGNAMIDAAMVETMIAVARTNMCPNLNA